MAEIQLPSSSCREGSSKAQQPTWHSYIPASRSWTYFIFNGQSFRAEEDEKNENYWLNLLVVHVVADDAESLSATPGNSLATERH